MPDAPEEPDRSFRENSADALTRRRFVASGVAVGAAVVWTANFPFSDAAIGQTITSSGGPTGATGPTGAEAQDAQDELVYQMGPAVGTAVPPPSHAGGGAPFSWAASGEASGEIELTVHHPETGEVKFLATHGRGPSRINYASLDTEVQGSGVSYFSLSPIHRGKSALRRSRRHRHHFHVHVVISFVPVDRRGVPQVGKRVTQHGKITIPN